MTNWREYGEAERACQSECRHCLMGGWIADMSNEGRRLLPAGLAQVSPRASSRAPMYGKDSHPFRACCTRKLKHSRCCRQSPTRGG
jgi:hypothetical protein